MKIRHLESMEIPLYQIINIHFYNYHTKYYVLQKVKTNN